MELKQIIEKFRALRNRMPVPNYESGYIPSDEEWDVMLEALEETESFKVEVKRLKELISGIKYTS